MSDHLHLYDTRSASVRPFEPAGPTVTLYVCGVTPYDTAHLGHAFTYVHFDVLVRYLRSLGYTVRYVQNVTDIDDPLFEKARELGTPFARLAADETARYLADMAALNVLPADLYPRAADEIPGMIDLARQLAAGNHTYDLDGRLYFRIASDPRYGELSHLDREEMIEIARERGGDPDDPRKHDPLDFLLWRPAGPDEPRAGSPWGDGLPGWHLECSAMALKYLGASLDIHGGGADLIFPHHESEIAQSESATGVEPFARFWMHTAMVYMDGEKMSKSLGNMVFARDLMESHGADAVRLYILRCRYRTELHWNPAELDRARDLAGELAAAAVVSASGPPSPIDIASYRARFFDRMNDDLDTPAAIEVLLDLARAIRGDASGGLDVSAPVALLRELGDILGLTFEDRSPLVLPAEDGSSGRIAK